MAENFPLIEIRQIKERSSLYGVMRDVNTRSQVLHYYDLVFTNLLNLIT